MKTPFYFHFTFVTLSINLRTMKINWFCFFVSILMLFSCQKNDEKQFVEQQKDANKKEQIFANINKGWVFKTPSLNTKSQAITTNWAELRLFNTELNQKPKSTIGAFQKKAKTLSKKVLDLNNNIPTQFNKPEIKSRIAVLTTKINSINLFINLQEVPDQKIISLINDTNAELKALYAQMDEIIRKSEIPKEQGESDMIRMLDTARAIPNSTPVIEPVSPILGRPFKKMKPKS